MDVASDEMETDLERVHNCYEICTRLRRTMKTRTRKSTALITAGGSRFTGLSSKQLFSQRRRSAAFSIQGLNHQRRVPDTVLYPVSLLCRESCAVRCTIEASLTLQVQR